ncbi:MAG: DUF6106 family protein [Lachnospiraceae bacterium]
MDISIEQIIKIKQPEKAKVFKILMIIACCVSAIFIIYAIGILSLAIMVVLTVFMFRYYDAEYEYIFVDKSMDIDRIMARSSRKRMGSYDFSKLEIMAYAGHGKLETYERMNCKTYNYASGYNPDKEYIVYINNNNEMIKLIIEPNDKIIDAIKRIDTRKVFLREENS